MVSCLPVGSQALRPFTPAWGAGTTRLGPARKGDAGEANLRFGRIAQRRRQRFGKAGPDAWCLRSGESQTSPAAFVRASNAAASTASRPAIRDDRVSPLTVGRDDRTIVPNIRLTPQGLNMGSAASRRATPFSGGPSPPLAVTRKMVEAGVAVLFEMADWSKEMQAEAVFRAMAAASEECRPLDNNQAATA